MDKKKAPIHLLISKSGLLLHPLSKQRFHTIGKERKNKLNFFLKKLAGLKIRVTFATPFRTTVLNVEKKFEKS